ncbi:MAG: Ku protein [Gordonia sp. (in: high G+C Gram-positive bacteria)]|uniref:non-homologous end joining protein Ku n=1 Tax=Gordonia sp. (in: high G+C Gram-positive bacteria) TaxID=84139 RepID=UPI0039E276AB
MRSIWKGDVSFGLVNVPVKVYSATESHDRASHQVDAKDGTRIRYRRVREGTDTEVDFANIANAYEADDGRTVVLTKDDIASLPVNKSPEIAITEFVPADQVDPIYFDKAYYLEPASKSPKAYVLLAQALESTDRLAIATFTLRSRTRMAALRVIDGVMTLQTLLWPDEIRKPDFAFLDEDVAIRPQELDMASSLIDTMATDFDPEQFEDTYETELAKLIEAKADGGDAFTDDDAAAAPADSDEVADLLAALRASVADRAAPAGKKKPATGAGTKAANTKTASTKTASTKTASTKTASTKTAGTKTTKKKAAS